MATEEFSFDGAISEEAPYIKATAFTDLPKGSVINGVVAYVETFKGYVKAAVLINGHTTRVTLWDMSIDQAKQLIGQPIKLKFTGMNEEGYPNLYVRW